MPRIFMSLIRVVRFLNGNENLHFSLPIILDRRKICVLAIFSVFFFFFYVRHDIVVFAFAVSVANPVNGLNSSLN